MTPIHQSLPDGTKVCNQGHVYIPKKRKCCPICRWEADKKWRKDNPEKWNKCRKKYRENHSKELSAKYKSWYERNIDRQKKKKLEYSWNRGLWNTWYAMIRRCTCPSDHAYKNYGGRGITVCERWIGEDGYKHFLEDMGDKPSPLHSLDRRNNDLGYSPNNCWWRTHRQQSMNRRSSKLLTLNGRTQCATEWADEIGISAATIVSRLNLYGWSVEEALTLPLHTRRTNLPTSVVHLLQGEQVTWQRRKRRSANSVTRPERRSQPRRGSVGASGGRNRKQKRDNPNHKNSRSGDSGESVPRENIGGKRGN